MVEALKQVNLFTGELVDNRTRQQKAYARQLTEPQQTLMFSQREIAQFGVNPRPLFPLSPSTKLVLQREDPRTEEEIERDLMREAEALTSPMFATEVVPDNAGEKESPPVAHTAERLPEPEPRTSSPTITVRRRVAGEGLRARLRRERICVRTREAQRKAPEVVPMLWMEREHIQKRLPYLGEAILRLDEEALEALAEGISAVLQEAYWHILSITLTHVLDYEHRATTP